MSLRVSPALILALGVVCLKADVDWRFAHPQAEMLMGVRVRSLVESPLGDAFREQAKVMGSNALNAGMLEEIEEVYVSVVSKRGKNGKVTDSDGLVLLVGNFDGGKLMKLLQGAEFRQGRKEALTPRFLDRGTILLGDEDAMIAAVERMKDPTRRGALFTNPLFERATELNEGNEFWMVGSVAPIAGAAAGPADGPFGFLNDLRSFSFGLGMRDKMRLDVGLNMRSRKAADEMIAALQSIQQQMRKQMKDPAEWEKIENSLKVSTAGTSLRVQMEMDSKDLRRSVDQVMAARANATAELLATNGAARPAGQPQAPPPPPQPMRRTVIVYGQESGTQEIPVPARVP